MACWSVRNTERGKIIFTQTIQTIRGVSPCLLLAGSKVDKNRSKKSIHFTHVKKQNTNNGVRHECAELWSQISHKEMCNDRCTHRQKDSIAQLEDRNLNQKTACICKKVWYTGALTHTARRRQKAKSDKLPEIKNQEN